MRGLSDYYLSIMARRLGVSPMFLDDALQEAKIAMWLAPDAPERTVAKYAMIDFVRRVGSFGRGAARRDTEALTDIHYAPDPYAIVDMLLDFRAAWARLVPTQRKVLLERAHSDYIGHDGLGWSNAHQVRVSRARLRLRKLVA